MTLYRAFTGDPMDCHAGREMLDHVLRFGIGPLDASFQASCREAADGNFGGLELELLMPALTVLAVAHGCDVIGRATVETALGPALLEQVRAEDWLLDAGRKAAAAAATEIDRGLLRYLGATPPLEGLYRATMSLLENALDDLRLTA
jgi:hypothetical protein